MTIDKQSDYLKYSGRIEEYNLYLADLSLQELIKEYSLCLLGIDEIKLDESRGVHHYYDESAYELYADILIVFEDIHNMIIEDTLNYDYEYHGKGVHEKHYHKEVVSAPSYLMKGVAL